MDYIELERRVEKHRRAQHMTQEDLAEKLEISASFLDTLSAERESPVWKHW